MEGNSIPKAAFTVIKNYRAQSKPTRKQSCSIRQKTVKRVRKLTLNTEELQKQQAVMSDQREPASANPELCYTGNHLNQRPVIDELEQGIPFNCNDIELQMESPLTSPRKYSEDVREGLFVQVPLFQMDPSQW